jgi:hypothetical protein
MLLPQCQHMAPWPGELQLEEDWKVGVLRQEGPSCMMHHRAAQQRGCPTESGSVSGATRVQSLYIPHKGSRCTRSM